MSQRATFPSENTAAPEERNENINNINNGNNIKKEINKLNNIDFKSGDVLEVLKNNKFVPDIIIVDPPRAGLDKGVIEQIIKLKPKKLIYVSCDVITLARDLNILKEYFDIKEVTPVDMFPNTYHVETVTLLNLKK